MSRKNRAVAEKKSMGFPKIQSSEEFALQMGCTSMSPTILPDDYVCFDPKKQPKHDDVVALIDENNEYLIRRFKVKEGIPYLVNDKTNFSYHKPYRIIGVAVNGWRELNILGKEGKQ